MKLNAWLKQNPAFSKRLQVVERLAQALNAVHDRGEPLAALDPEHVEVDGECDCDISAARRGNPAPGYCAPERTEGGPPSPEADIYAAGAIAWEVLSGRPYAAAPSHLAEAAREVQRDLADAVMACLEQSPQWRPRDLTYIAQLAQHTLGTGSRDQATSRPASARATARPGTSRSVSARSGRATSGRTTSSRSAKAASPIRTTPLHEPRSHAMLAVIAGVIVTVAGAGYYWMTRDKGTSAPATVPPTTVAPSALTVTARPEPPPEVLATRPPVTVASAPPVTAPPAPVPTVAPTPVPTPIPTPARLAPTATPYPPPVTLARALPPPPVTQPVRTPTPPPVVVPVPTTTTTTVAAAAIPLETPVLSTVSPPAVRRPGKYLLDLRGTGLRSDLRARVVPLKQAPHGITIVRQVCKTPFLFQVLIDLGPEVTPGGYAITLADASGGQTAPLTLTVNK